MSEPNLTSYGRTLTVKVPISIRSRGGRKLVIAPDGTDVTIAPVCRHIDNTIVKAIARAFRWREMLEDGNCATIREIAANEKINESYVGRVLRITLLAPDIVDVDLEWATAGNATARAPAAAISGGLGNAASAVLGACLIKVHEELTRYGRSSI